MPVSVDIILPFISYAPSMHRKKLCTTYSSLLTETLSLRDCDDEQLLPIVDSHGESDRVLPKFHHLLASLRFSFFLLLFLFFISPLLFSSFFLFLLLIRFFFFFCCTYTLYFCHACIFLIFAVGLGSNRLYISFWFVCVRSYTLSSPVVNVFSFIVILYWQRYF